MMSSVSDPKPPEQIINRQLYTLLIRSVCLTCFSCENTVGDHQQFVRSFSLSAHAQMGNFPDHPGGN